MEENEQEVIQYNDKKENNNNKILQVILMIKIYFY